MQNENKHFKFIFSHFSSFARGTFHWAAESEGTTNATGFTALPGGLRMTGGVDSFIGDGGHWWSSTPEEGSLINAWDWDMYYTWSGVGRANNLKRNGFSIRCMRYAELPAVTTAPISNITAISALSGGNVTSDGGVPIIERGVCWSITENPTIADNKSWASAGTGSYTCNLANLDPNTLYYVRAFARNSVGTAYGNQVFFTTSAELSLISFPDLTYGTVSDIDGNNYRTIQIGSQVWMAENLKTTKYNDNTSISIAINDNEWYTLTTPAYCWYKNDAGNYKAIYGALYNWYVGDAASNGGKNVCPVGWHIPSNAEWTTLTDYLGGTIVAGGKLKEVGTSHWWIPNEGASNETGFTAIPGGGRIKDGDFYGHFGHIGEIGFWWSQTTDVSDRMLRYNDGEVDLFSVFPKQCGFSIRCVKSVELPVVTTIQISSITTITAQSGGDITSDGGGSITARGVCWSTSTGPTADLLTKTTDGTGAGIFSGNITGIDPGTTYYVRAYATNSVGTAYGNEISFTTLGADAVADGDGNIYNTVTIGEQTWITENLKTTRYNDGTGIPHITINTDWANLTSPGYCWFLNQRETYGNTYGALYNWYVVDAISNGGKNVCPVGWHVPVDAEWTRLIDHLGGEEVAGGKLKETGTDHWCNPNVGATNESGFTARAGGFRDQDGGFYSNAIYGNWWSTTDNTVVDPASWSIFMSCGMNSVSRQSNYNKRGLSIRCMKNTKPLLRTNPIIAISKTDAQSGGYISADGGVPILTRGVCWGTEHNPTIDLETKTQDGEGPGNFVSTISGLLPGITYHVRSYATNINGISYGEETSFITYRSDAITDVDWNYYNIIRIGNQIWTQENLKTTKFNDGTSIPKIENEVTWPGWESPAYCYLNNNESTYKNLYGVLYNHFVTVYSLNACPTGWHVPTHDEWSTLVDNLGGPAVAGGKLKETGLEHWSEPNFNATNSTGFTALPGGYRDQVGTFSNPGDHANFWTSTVIGDKGSWAYHLSRFDEKAVGSWNDDVDGFSIRCVQSAPTVKTIVKLKTKASIECEGNITTDGGFEVTERGICYSINPNPTIENSTKISDGTGPGSYSITLQPLIPETTYYIKAYAINTIGTGYSEEMVVRTYGEDAVTDFDGNFYNTITIGTQTWLQENTKVTHYRNGDPIPEVTDGQSWGSLNSGAYCNFNNNVSNVNIYGRLYNAYAVIDSRGLCPADWHVPTHNEWITMEKFLLANGYNYDGSLDTELDWNTNKIAKAMASKNYWTFSEVTGSVGNTDFPDYRNKSGLTGLPSGYRYPDGIFYRFGEGAVWWSSTETDATRVMAHSIWYNWTNVIAGNDLKVDGFSVRCIKNTIKTIVVTNTNDSGEGSLRNALEYANSNPGEDIITFNIPGTGPFTIQPQEALPEITDPVVIDGYTQTGSNPATASDTSWTS